MNEIDKAKTDQVKDTLRDDEIDAVTGGAWYAKFQAMKGDEKGLKLPVPLAIPLPLG